ncbi:MAG: substrate-binding domain-containing protein [Tepidisphaeraceae bacterium]
MTEGLPQRLAKTFRQKIAGGEWPAGERLPTTRELAAEYKVSVNTVQSAFRELAAAGLVERRPRIGGFVRGRSDGATARKANTIGVIGPYTEAGYTADPSNSWAYRIIRGCDRELSPHGYHVTIFSYNAEDPDAGKHVLERIEQASDTLAGVLCFINPVLKNFVDELDQRNIAWVAVNRPRENASQNFVAHDSFSAARLVARCYAKMGFERALVLSDSLASGRSAGDKFFGFMEGWIESGKASRTVDFVDCEGFQEQQGYDAFRKYLSQYGVPRGVLASGDLLALGTLRACREQGISIPNELAIIGGTGLQLSAYSHPTLSVLDTPMEQMGADAAQMLLAMAREGVRRMVGRYSKVNLITRESCPIPQDLLEAEQAAIEELR